MSDMDGNPHYDEAQRLIHADKAWQGVGYETADAQHIVGHLEADTQAALALAYEQRTANLIASISLGIQVIAAKTHLASDAEALAKVIAVRLGLTDGSES